MVFPTRVDMGLPQNHIYDKVVSARIDLNRFWNVKLEGHFMDGYGDGPYPDGLYPGDNPAGFKPNTNALVVNSSDRGRPTAAKNFNDLPSVVWNLCF